MYIYGVFVLFMMILGVAGRIKRSSSLRIHERLQKKWCYRQDSYIHSYVCYKVGCKCIAHTSTPKCTGHSERNILPLTLARSLSVNIITIASTHKAIPATNFNALQLPLTVLQRPFYKLVLLLGSLEQTSHFPNQNKICSGIGINYIIIF